MMSKSLWFQSVGWYDLLQESGPSDKICTAGDFLLNDLNIMYEPISYGKSSTNKTKGPRQIRELIVDSDSGIFDFWSFDEKNNG